MSDPLNVSHISSPVATGGAGTFFEQHVNAFWLAQLLVQAIPPILIDCTLIEVDLQTEHLGWRTDDFLLVGQNGTGEQRKLAGQIKRTFSVSASDEDCRKAIQDFWIDFNNPQLFSPATDRFALVTQHGTNALLHHFFGLLDCARNARDGDDFARRLARQGFIHARSVKYCNAICTIIGEIEGRIVSAFDVWPFLRVIHIVSLDLHSSTHQTEAMIKSLLAHTANDPDANSVATASWNSLLCEVGEGNSGARCYRRDDLPDVLRQRHSLIGGDELRVLGSLHDHSTLILEGIRSTIGSELHLGRARLVQQVIEELESHQVVLVMGAAGSGKSCVAKDAIGRLSTDHFAFGFRAEEFAHPHFDATLQNSRIPASATQLGAILASQARKILLVESVERLLEKSTREAFTDLLTLIARDKSWQLVLTCRDYSAELIRTCFLQSADVGHSVVTVPPLDDEELEAVKSAHPELARPLANASLRNILRNPYMLDKALQISWSAERPLPQSERDFRTLFWKQIVRADHLPAYGMPRRREEAFMQIALHRARALTQYTACNAIDPEIVAALKCDSLIVCPQQSEGLAAPAHDVLEDWAISQWIEEQYALHQYSVRELSEELGTHPAIRRTYRKWVSELVDRDPDTADGLFQAAVHATDLPAQFRDDTLVSLLRSGSSVAFLERHSTELFANDMQLLRRVIHLLMVACVKTSDLLSLLAAHGSMCNVPDGPAWACVLQLVQAHLSSFAERDCSFLLGFIEDWSRGVTYITPYPDGADSVATIAHWLLPAFDDYRSEDQRKRTLRVIAKIPKMDPERFTALLFGNHSEKRDRMAEYFQKIIFEGMEGMPAARDIPEIVVAAANAYLLCSEEDLDREHGFVNPMATEQLFGIKGRRSFGFFPASAYRGPLFHLMRHHPYIGLDFIISVFNQSAEWYADPRVRLEYDEPRIEIILSFEDGTSRTQWCNSRLWNLYRGTTVAPYALQSLLMALERWLMELGMSSPEILDTVLMQILKMSDSSALTSVVASIGTAFPHASGEALLVLLRSPLCIALDRQRLACESQSPSKLADMFPRSGGIEKVYNDERKEMDALPHRRQDIEAAILQIQTGPFATRVHEILDRHRAEMPPVEAQNENDRLWRLAMLRMDLRQYAIAEDMTTSSITPDGTSSPEDGEQYVHLALQGIEPDIREMVDQSAPQFQSMNAKLGLLTWGMNVFNYEDRTVDAVSLWRVKLHGARTLGVNNHGEEDEDLAQGGPGWVAAVCVRDHWEEMSSDEREWCVDIVCSEVARVGDHWDQLARVQRNPMSADRPCAKVLSLLIGASLSDENNTRVQQMLVVALTHAIDEVRWYAAYGVRMHLWGIDKEFTMRCINALATEATLVQTAMEAENQRPYEHRQQFDEIRMKAARMVRRLFFDADGIEDEASESMDPRSWFGAEANGRILAILGQAPTETVAVATFERAAHILVESWDADDKGHGARGEHRQERNHEAETAQSDLLQYFVLRTSTEAASNILQPILDAVDRHPDKVYWFLIGLIKEEYRQPNPSQFWSLWELFAEKVRHATWLERIDREHSMGTDMLSAIFLVTFWNDETRHWRSLEGYAEHVHRLFDYLPASSMVLDKYVRFLYHIGEQSLPDAFIRIATRLQHGDPLQMLRQENTVYMLEVLLQRYVYGRPLELKLQRDLREAVLFLLDQLIENGSSSAFRMRDDFVTPVSLT